MKLMNKTKNNCTAEKVTAAKSLGARLKGLLGESSLPDGETLWIHNCPSIHTFFMQFAIDAVFVDNELKVKACYENVKPWRLIPYVFGASSVFEFSVGAIAKSQIEIGDQLYVGH